MGAKASIHMTPMKAMNASLSDENERRNKSKEWFDRTEDSKGTPYHYDWYRRNLNFEIVKGKICPQLSHDIPLHERIQNRLRELGFKNYKVTAKNAPNICMDFVIGGQRERLREIAFGNQVIDFEKSDEKNIQVKRMRDVEQWALDTYKWACKRYGEENIIGFNVHLDETTPHIHMQVVPVAEKKRRGRVKAGQERGTVKTVSYAGVVGETPEALAKYLNEMHTDYHLQVGYKYGLERGTFFDDLTPEEQALRPKGNRSKHLYILEEKIKQAEKKLKGLNTMLHNLEEQKEAIEIDIAALEEERDNGNEEAAKKIAELTERLNQLNIKILERNEQISNAKEQLRELAIRRHSKENEYDDLMRRKNKVADQFDQKVRDLENADKELKRKREEIEKADKSGELSRQKNYVDEREKIIFRRWPAAEAATRAIIDRGSSRTARQFSTQQALQVEQAIQTSGTTRQEAAADLCRLAEKEFEENRTWQDWVDEAFDEVMSIADHIHPLSAFLQQQSASGGGGSSYINDLTGWDGKKRR